jgi:membrane protease YdiL (CAAX protease family)
LFILIFVRLVTALLPDSVPGFKEFVMQVAIQAMTVIAGMILSLAVAVVAEELIFGQVFRLFFARQAGPVKSGEKR